MGRTETTGRSGGGIGFGTATVMRLPTARQQRSIISAAWDLGFRHFDTAPLYGLGEAEKRLGEVLRTRTENHTVYTKVGLAPALPARLIGRMQQPLRLLLQRVPHLRGFARRAAAGTVRAVPMDGPSVWASLEGSLRRLHRERVDGMLIHDRSSGDIAHGAVQALEKAQESGLVVDLGAAGARRHVAQLLQGVSSRFSVAQVPGGGADLIQQPAPRVIVYGVLGGHLPTIFAAVDRNVDLRRRTESALDLPLRSRVDIAAALLRLELGRDDSDLILVSSTSAAHLRELYRAYEDHQRAPIPRPTSCAVLQALVDSATGEVS